MITIKQIAKPSIAELEHGEIFLCCDSICTGMMNEIEEHHWIETFFYERMSLSALPKQFNLQVLYSWSDYPTSDGILDSIKKYTKHYLIDNEDGSEHRKLRGN